jgi:hypothetical protein
MDRTKNDPRGDGPIEGRTCRMMCGCADSVADKKRFLAEQRTDPFVPCFMDCPFQTLVDYMSIIPDPLGRGQEAMRLTNPDAAGATLKLMRARTTHAPRVFIRANLGIGKLREIMQRINQKLPEKMQVHYFIYFSYLLIF